MSMWLILVVAALIGAYLMLRLYIKSSPKREGPTADDREAIVGFERTTARKGAMLIDTARRRLAGEVEGIDEATRLASLRGACQDLIACWPSDPLAPGEAFAFLRASVCTRHPAIRMVLDESGYAGLETVARGAEDEAAEVLRAAAHAWQARLDGAHQKLAASQENVWSSLTLLGMGMMGLEPDSHAEQAVGAQIRRVLREQPAATDLEATVAAALWLLSTVPAAERVERDGVAVLPLEDGELGAIATQLLMQQASKGTPDQRARAVARGRWELLWLAHALVLAVPDNETAERAFGELGRIAHEAVQRGWDSEPLASFEAAAQKLVGEQAAKRVAGIAEKLAGGQTQEQVVGGAPGHEREARGPAG